MHHALWCPPCTPSHAQVPTYYCTVHPLLHHIARCPHLTSALCALSSPAVGSLATLHLSGSLCSGSHSTAECIALHCTAPPARANKGKLEGEGAQRSSARAIWGTALTCHPGGLQFNQPDNQLDSPDLQYNLPSLNFLRAADHYSSSKEQFNIDLNRETFK